MLAHTILSLKQMALAIRFQSITRIAIQENVTYLTKFPGVGKKTAQQMILDLKGKLGELESSEAAVAAMTATEAVTTSNQALAEALEALSALGYSDREIKRITKQLEALGETTTDVYLSNALKFMMKR